MLMSTFEDSVGTLHGHWLCEVYAGDVVREPLTLEQLAENNAWLEDALISGRLPEGRHLGRVLNEKVHEFEGENLVTTTGKGLILDRLFGLAAAVAVTSCGVGATAAAAVVADTQLGSTPTILNFDALPTRSGLVVTAITTFGTGSANINWNELAQFNGTVNGTSTMLNRIAPIGPFNKTSAVSIVTTTTLTQG